METTKIRMNVIQAAKQGDGEAMEKILHHYDPLIHKMASTTQRDSDGHYHTVVDQQLKDRIATKLMLQIFYKYEVGGKTGGQ